MKYIVLLLLAFSPFVKAQESYQGLISNSYKVANSKGLRTVNNPIYIIWNRNFCKLYVNNTAYYFPIDAYSNKMEKGIMQESFLNEETESSARGWFLISIDHNKSGTSNVTINLPMMPGGCAYFMTDAQRYSENGKVTGHVEVINWKEIEDKIRTSDSLRIAGTTEAKAQQLKEQSDDSIYRVNQKIKENSDIDNLLKKGNNLYVPRNSFSISKTIDSALNMIVTDKYISGNIELHFDADGNITYCRNGLMKYPDIESIIPTINELLPKLKLKVEPYKGSNGKAYPSYANIDIAIAPNFYQSNKGRKK